MKKLPLIIRCSRDIHSSWPASSSFAAYQVSKSYKCTNWVGIACFRLQLAQPISPLLSIIINWCECSNLFSEASVESVASDGVGSICSLSISGERLTSARAPLQLASKPSFTGLAKNLPSQDYWTFLQVICKSHQDIWGLGVSEWKRVSCIFCWVYITTI